MAGPIRDLADAAQHGGSIRAECRRCGRVALFSVAEIDWYWQRKKWDRSWPNFAWHLKCQCGERGRKMSWLTSPPPPDDEPTPPKPRFTRSPLPRAVDDNVVPIRRRRAT